MRWATGLAAALALCACTPTAPTAHEGSPPPAPSTSDPRPIAAATTPTSDPPTRPLTIAVAGDVHFEGVLRRRLDEPATALAPVTRALAAADLAIINLETSVGVGGSPDPSKRFTFQAPPTAFRAVAEAGIDVVSLANNHVLDFGRRPLPGMFSAIRGAATAEPELAVVGVGRDLDAAFRPARSTIRGTVVATIGATLASTDPTADPTGQWAATARSPGTADAVDPARLLRAVRRADDSADVVVVYLHWGIQGESCPTADQRTLAADLVEGGADVVVGSHAHQLQGDGHLGRGYVAYGLGNYAWYSPGSRETSTTGVLTLTVRPPREPGGRARVVDRAWTPARIGTDGLPRQLSGAAVGAFEARTTVLRDCAGVR